MKNDIFVSRFFLENTLEGVINVEFMYAENNAVNLQQWRVLTEWSDMALVGIDYLSIILE